jgi:hypothetical protein
MPCAELDNTMVMSVLTREGFDMRSIPASDKYFLLVADRECGECMVCCHHLSINAPNLKKPADVLCDNCMINNGCRIYETRPNVCRTWHCLWRRTEALQPELRPDKSGVIFSLKINYEPRYIFENAYIACMALTNPCVFNSPAVSEAIDMFVKESSFPVWLSFQGSKSLFYPGAELANAITTPSTTESTPLLEQGKSWLDNYNAMLEPLQNRQAMFGHEFLRI